MKSSVRFNSRLLTTSTFGSAALGLLVHLVHRFPQAGTYQAVVLRDGQRVGTTCFRVTDQTAATQLNIDLPIANRQRGGLTAIGNLSLNGNVEIEQLSDFGTLVTTGYGVTWSPVPQARFIFSVTDEEGAPSANQLGDPLITTPNVRVFDYVRGETVDITAISGG